MDTQKYSLKDNKTFYSTNFKSHFSVYYSVSNLEHDMINYYVNGFRENLLSNYLLHPNDESVEKYVQLINSTMPAIEQGSMATNGFIQRCYNIAVNKFTELLKIK